MALAHVCGHQVLRAAHPEQQAPLGWDWTGQHLGRPGPQPTAADPAWSHQAEVSLGGRGTEQHSPSLPLFSTVPCGDRLGVRGCCLVEQARRRERPTHLSKPRALPR